MGHKVNSSYAGVGMKGHVQGDQMSLSKGILNVARPIFYPNKKYRGHCMCKEISVIPVNRVHIYVKDPKENNRENGVPRKGTRGR
jgi:hypothetical protein